MKKRVKPGTLYISAVCVQDKTVEISLRLSPKQLDHVTPVLEEIIHEIVEERQKGTALQW